MTFHICIYIYIYWECHHPNWRSHIFQRGRLKPATSNHLHYFTTLFAGSFTQWRCYVKQNVTTISTIMGIILYNIYIYTYYIQLHHITSYYIILPYHTHKFTTVISVNHAITTAAVSKAALEMYPSFFHRASPHTWRGLDMGPQIIHFFRRISMKWTIQRAWGTTMT